MRQHTDVGGLGGPGTVSRRGHHLGPFAHVPFAHDASAYGRGRRLARHAGSAAVAHALAAGLLPQWRARPPASRRVARSLGFRELGSQLSVRLEMEALDPVSTHSVDG
ncbi:GNAT family N-acetyltransferase [Streptomyces aureus]|uniref:GNAT family N-acetyltransferase n=1 Tax=Streptomyces aureus TaxID=193461 RepID=UPI003F5D52C7